MLPMLLLVAVLGVGVLLMFGMLMSATTEMRRRRDARVRAALHAARVAEAPRVKAELAAQRAKLSQPIPQRAPEPAPMPAPAMYQSQVGEITGIIATLEQSARFARLPSAPPVPSRGGEGRGRMPLDMGPRFAPVPAPPKRAAKGSVPPPIPASAALRSAPIAARTVAHPSVDEIKSTLLRRTGRT